MNLASNPPVADVLVIGSGIMGAAVTQLLREQDPETTIIMVDGGPVIGSRPGQHLHDTPDEDIQEQFLSRVAAGNQALYVGASRVSESAQPLLKTEPGMHGVSDFGSDASQMEGSSVSWNVGGVGAHWSAATPWPYGPEVVDFSSDDEWKADLETAQRLLKVHPSPFGTTTAGERVLDALDEVFGPDSANGRHVQPMPMAVTISDTGLLLRTGPNMIYPPMATGTDDNFQLLAETLATEITYEGSTATGAATRNTRTGEVSAIRARFVIVCGDTLRTPQLLWASGIRPQALGRYLNEHAFLMGKVAVDLERLAINEIPVPKAREWSTSTSWLPTSGDQQPFHGQIMQSPSTSDGRQTPDGYSVVLALYVPTEIRTDNWVEFSDDETDRVGMPRMTIHFSYSEKDLALIEQARERQATAGDRLGTFDPATDSLLLAAGSSLHYTGTVRMGATNDGTSVCDPNARVWDFDNLFLAGNGVVPTALAANSTLTGAVTAVRAANAIGALLRR